MADDAERGVCSGGEIYQLRVVIAGISPLIWRRLLVTGETTIAQLHTIAQTLFGWSGEPLHPFTVRGRAIGSGELWCAPRGEGPPRRSWSAGEGTVHLLLPLLRRLAGRSAGRADSCA